MLLSLNVFLLVFIYFYPLTLRFSYRPGRLELQWLPRLCGGFATPRTLNPHRIGAKKERRSDAIKNLSGRWRSAWTRPMLERLPGHICVEHLHCSLQMGIGSPFAGSMLMGVALAAFGGFNGVAATLFKRFPACPHLELTTSATGGFSGSLECIIQIRCGDIIGDMLYVLWKSRKRRAERKKGGKQNVQRA